MMLLWCNASFTELRQNYFLPCPWLVGVGCFVLGLFLLIFACLMKTVWSRKKYHHLLTTDEEEEDIVCEKKPLSTKDIEF
ncbi:protein UL41A [macacine betaherpesvirus 3]|uniref:Rh67.1 n=1 Tax=Rhesus cytomegalovirus (strain 68-1) TaxID=47929 RepID=I3WF99_RHCM6|nr:Rh67.1 [macacine betaherpesvirus 3]QMS44167.1 Rh67.1 [synthetic construct]QQL10374.1 Rh67.1 [macacine betaherpesvirus 3]QQL10553.1 Rh67.1 [Rhesus cytomegalovirus strain 68-1.2]QQL10735.1 Rh67.1 [Rhesus cytomegalovirus strain 68-1_FL]